MAKIAQHCKYLAAARVPPDRLLSGLLTVNLRNAYDNTDDKDDTVQAYNDHWGDLSTGQKHSYPFGDEQPITLGSGGSKAVNDPGREERYQSFADYDCFLFWVAGGMTLHSTLTYGTSHVNPVGYATTSGTWYESIVDRRCNSYVRSHLISRANNAYGHNADGTTYYGKGTGIKRIQTLANDDVATGAITSTYLADGTSTDYLYNNADYSPYHASHDDKYDLDTPGNNTFFTPVRDVRITGSHRFSTTTRTDPAGYADTSGTFYQFNHHDTSFWTLRVTVLLYGYQADNGTDIDAAADDGTADKIRTDYNINVFYQPFGETPDLDFALTQWSS